MKPPLTLVCGTPNDAIDEPSWTPFVGARIPPSLSPLDHLPEVLDEITRGVRPTVRTAFQSLAPWFGVWLHRILETSLDLPKVDPNWTAVRCVGLDQFEQALIVGWAKENGLEVEAARSMGTRRTGSLATKPLTQRIGAVLRPGRPLAEVDVLAVSLQQNSTRDLAPHLVELRRANLKVQLALLGEDSTSVDIARHANVPFLYLDGYVSPLTPFSFVSARRTFHSLITSATFFGFIEKFDRPKWLSPALLVELLRRPAWTRFVAAWLKAEALSKLLNAAKPCLLLAASDHAVACHSAADHKIRSATFLQGVVPDLPRLEQRLPTDVVFVGSELDYVYTDSSRISRKSVELIGHRRNRAPSADARESLRTRLLTQGNAGAKALVVFTSQYPTEAFPDWARRKNLSVVIECARRVRDVAFAIRLHPRRETLPGDLRSTLPSNVHLPDVAIETSKLISAADVAVTYWSTTALEALLHGVPLVQLNATGLADYYQLSSRFGEEVVRDASELEKRIRELLGDRDRRVSQLERQNALLMDAKVNAPASSKPILDVALAAIENVRSKHR